LRSDETVGSALTTLEIALPLDPVKRLIGNSFVDPDATGVTTIDAVNRCGKQTGFGSPAPASALRRPRRTAHCS
jgi:two-component system CheB/CheR fusion protein